MLPAWRTLEKGEAGPGIQSFRMAPPENIFFAPDHLQKILLYNPPKPVL